MDKYKYKNEYNKNKKRKLFRILLIITIVSFVIGIFYVAVISKVDKELIKRTFDTFFLEIKNNTLNRLDGLLTNITTNVLLTIIVWVMGISILGIPISIIYLIYKSFVLGFTISSLIFTYKLNGIVISLIYSFPLFINLFIIFILTFYAINFSKKLYLNLFKKKDINMSYTMKIYLKFLFISIIILLISSLISSYIVPILLNIKFN